MLLSSVSRALIACILLLAVTAVGYETGAVIGTEGATVVGLAFLVGVGCLVSCPWQHSKGPPAGATNSWAIALAGYVVFILLLNELSMVVSEAELLRTMVLLTPVVAGFVLFMSRGRWIESVGTLLILFGTTMALAHNVFHRLSGIGAFVIRRE